MSDAHLIEALRARATRMRAEAGRHEIPGMKRRKSALLQAAKRLAMAANSLERLGEAP